MSNKICIECMWAKADRVLINPDGQVYPCCYLGNLHYAFMNDPNPWLIKQYSENEALKKYNDNKEEYNIKNHTLQEIMSSDWFNVDLPDSWESDETVPQPCERMCKVINEDQEL